MEIVKNYSPTVETSVRAHVISMLAFLLIVKVKTLKRTLTWLAEKSIKMKQKRIASSAKNRT